MYADHVERMAEAGADRTYLTMYQAGRSLATQTMEALEAPAVN